ncbi:hypothetical protein B6A10_15435 [Flavobacterium sp. L1I52]|uniref:GyrI-like small molecule binding domain-containing protein n=1 Tax=Flavobacterium pokkalii TaxID=1940408 RepID=A0ABR7UUS5_9FLAO|nr:hypothetical protein [Flavobacterium pokkalii]MBD0726565.1 hypothetical protein [Flavobacterium pokkalii]
MAYPNKIYLYFQYKIIGKKSVHLGGATQILFGIIGKRWELEYDMSDFFNVHWIRPNSNEKPKKLIKLKTVVIGK